MSLGANDLRTVDRHPTLQEMTRGHGLQTSSAVPEDGTLRMSVIPVAAEACRRGPWQVQLPAIGFCAFHNLPRIGCGSILQERVSLCAIYAHLANPLKAPWKTVSSRAREMSLPVDPLRNIARYGDPGPDCIKTPAQDPVQPARLKAISCKHR